MAKSSTKRVRLGDVCEINMGQSPDSKSYNQEGKGLPFYQGNADFGALHPSPRYWCNSPTKVANANDILISVRAPIGALNIADSKCCIGRGLSALRPKASCNFKYCYYFLKSHVNDFNAKGTGSTFKAINKKCLTDTEIPLPPLAEQKRIAEVLDKICELKKNAETRLQKLDLLIKSKFNEMFGDVKKHSKIGCLFKTQSGGTPKSSEHSYYDGGNIPWITSGEVNLGLITKAQKYITQAGFDNSSAKWTPANSVLVAMYGATAGKVALLKIKATTNQAICSILPSSDVDPEFLYYAVSQKESWMIQQASGVAQPNISQEIIRQMSIPIPMFSLQRKFATFVEKVEALKATAKKELEKVDLLYRAKLQEYFG